MPSSLSVRLFVELLELRETPAAFSTPWPDGEHLTLSFVPDGTAIGSVPSNLGQVFQSLGPAAKIEILRAFRTWAVAANPNIGLVNDNGAAFGTGGSVLGDSRFGDIRIGGRSLPNDVPAITAPYNIYGSHSGDVVLKTAAGGRDLFTIFLQEAGHSLGIGNSPDVASAMYEYHRGPRNGLSAGDLTAVRSLYGDRQPDAREGSHGNGTFGAAASSGPRWTPN